MKKTNTNKGLKKLIPAAGMLMLSAAMLGTSTFAWFTMNKEVSVVGMEMKAHAEEGLLINEVADADNAFWDEQAMAGDNEFVALRPASSYNMTNWWHANSLNMDKEAGLSSSGSVESYTAQISSGGYYDNISSGATNVNSEHRDATAGSVAERYIFYKNASFGNSGSGYDNGEGFYVNYKYYLKSSSSDGMSVDKGKFMITATATKKNDASGTDLDKAIRVGVKIGDDVLIFTPNAGDTSYNVTKDTSGTTFNATTAVNAETALVANSTDKISIPKVTQDGMLVDVYVWFEGEDQNCKSINLTETLNDYQIDLKFRINDLVG